MADDSPPQLAATVLLVRDIPGDIEVFMLKRNLNSDFVGGAYVFPGGKVDAIDRDDPDIEDLCEGRTDESASMRLDVDSGGLAHYVAAIRECFEEAGVLLARSSDGSTVRLVGDREADFEAARSQVYDGELRLAELCRREGLVLQVDQVEYLSHWITPMGVHRRFDTRFFVAHMPDGQEPLHDGGETVASEWISPRVALERQRAGEFEMIFPTIKNLEDVARFSTVDELLAACAARTSIPRILPRIVKSGDGFVPLIPGDDGYEEAERAQPEV